MILTGMVGSMKATQTALTSENHPIEPEQLGTVAHPMVVQTDRFKCMAYRDQRGKWIDYYHRVELTGNIEPIDPAPY
jgi:hypothetical protein